jgi:aromatic ring-opening dioxygenase LigB subunit
VPGLVFACIAPHGTEVIAELTGDNASRMTTTRRAMEELASRMEASQPETVVLITPHGVRVTGVVCVMATERAVGTLESEDGQRRIEVDMTVDTELALRIAQHAGAAYAVPTVTAIYGASSGESCFTPLDWGAVVPLWFLGARWNELGKSRRRGHSAKPKNPQEAPPKVVSITPSRALTLKQLYDFGTATAEVASEMGKRVALVASADWGHAHDATGPYGYDPASAEYDEMIQEVIRAGNLDQLLAADLTFAERAKVDGLWQAVTLAGALHHTPMRGELLSYEAPTYFGMLVAAYEPEYGVPSGFGAFRDGEAQEPDSGQ